MTSKKCPSCGEKYIHNHRLSYCGHCGFPLKILYAAARKKRSGVGESYRSQLRTTYDRNHPRYVEMIGKTKTILEADLKRHRSIKCHSVKSRIKEFDSFFDKVARLSSVHDPFERIQDICGVAVICLYKSDFSKIEKRIYTNFVVVKKECKEDIIPENQFGYDGNHYIIKLKNEHKTSMTKDLLAEIQVRTLLMDSWAMVSHDLDYKQIFAIPNERRRALFAMSGLLYMGDVSFINLRKETHEYLRSQPKMPKVFDLEQPLSQDTLKAYARWRFPVYNKVLETDEAWQNLVLAIEKTRYQSLADIHAAVEYAYGRPGFNRHAGPYCSDYRVLESCVERAAHDGF